jgi:hypothetical protein
MADTLDITYELNNPPVIAETLDGEVVAIDLDAGNYFGFRGPAVALWEALLAGAAPRELVAAVEGEGSREALADALQGFIDRLVGDALIRPRAETRASAPAPAAIAPWTAADLAYECYTDMQNLLGLDPVHEADERLGWPVQSS